MKNILVPLLQKKTGWGLRSQLERNDSADDSKWERETKMDWKIFLTTFGTIFLAELGDKTQLAAILMTSKTGRPLSVFVGAIMALSLVTAIGVIFGEGLISIIPQTILKKVAALAFMLIGIWMFFGK
jgi:putative Ca2+/H+ antiporter (TMEM165/GDT1 family)